MIGAMKLESFAERLEELQAEKLAVVVGDQFEHSGTHRSAPGRAYADRGTGGVLQIEPQILEAARKNGVSLISSPHDTSDDGVAFAASAVAMRHMV